MGESFFTIAREARVEQVIEKSRFIATAIPVNSREEAEERLQGIREEYSDATHNVPVMVIGKKSELCWCSDDGEPQGTSGPPMLRILNAKGITNILVVVTRYFGGIKLGTGGLVRAYSGSLEKVLMEAGVLEIKDTVSMSVKCDYQAFNRIESFRFPDDIILSDIGYGERVEFNLKCLAEQEEEVRKNIDNLSNGGAEYL